MSANKKTLLQLCQRVDKDVVGIEFVNSRKYGSSGWYKLYADSNAKPEFLGTTYESCLAMLIEQVEAVDTEPQEDLEQSPVVAELLKLELSDTQNEACEMICEVAAAKMGVAVLKGYAGTGKTTVVQRAAITMSLNGLRVAYCAPTNQAVKVLRNKIPHEVIATIHSLLGLTIKNKYGKKVLVKANSSQMRYFDALIIDEASMLGEELLGRIFDDFEETKRTSLIFVGDPKQLNPVNEEQSRAFDIDTGYELTEIVRQAEDNPILDATKRLRRMADFDFNKLRYTQSPTAETGLFRLRRSEVPELIEESFLSQNFKEDNDYIRILCWTNAKVNKLNKQIHTLIYGDTDTPYVVGERIIAREPIADGVVKNSEECEVLSIKSTMLVGFACWHLVLRTEHKVEVECYVLKEEVEGDYKARLDELAGNKDWQSFYEIAETFVSIQHVYAMTCHRSQGSTFDNVIVDASDILRNKNKAEMMRMLYVACSRPRYRCWLT